MTTQTDLHGYSVIAEPTLAFDPTDRRQQSTNALAGLRDFGPFSARMQEGAPDTSIRIALLAPKGDLEQLKNQLNQLVHAHKAKERAPYLPDWPGFQSVFRTKIGPADSSAQLALSSTLDEDLKVAAHPGRHLAGALSDGLRQLSIVRDRFDVVVFYLPPRFAPYFEDRETDFDLHDSVKATGAQLGLTTQIITHDALTYRCRASVAWRLSTALYAKAGHIPWKLHADAVGYDADTAYIGLSYAMRSDPSGGAGFITCCSQVFDADGGGMEFIAYEVGEGGDLRNPFLSREDMRLVMARSLSLYQDRHAGRTPTRLVVHKQTPFQDQEVSGCFDAWGASSDLACINITRPTWQGVTLDQPKAGETKARPGYAVSRGTSFQLDGLSMLVWIGGNAPAGTLNGRDNYYQGGKGTPRPLLLTRDAGSGPLLEHAGQAMSLSKMNWNNDVVCV